jgi:cold shock CspA family protein
VSPLATVNGAMVWFHEAKGYGFILTDQGERLYVDREGFLDGAAPVGRCGGLPVELRVEERDGRRVAVDVSLVAEPQTRRARRRSSAIRSARS